MTGHYILQDKKGDIMKFKETLGDHQDLETDAFNKCIGCRRIHAARTTSQFSYEDQVFATNFPAMNQ